MRKIRKTIRSTFNLFQKMILHILRFFIFMLKPKLIFSYNPNKPKDGTGAQLQRLLSIYCLAKYFNLNYKHNPILDISTHPLDPFQTQTERKEYVKKLNFIFSINSDSIGYENTINLEKLTVAILVKLIWRAISSDKYLNVAIKEPFPVVDRLPKCFDYLPTFNISENCPTSQIVIHYRQGVGNYAIYFDQAIPRQMEIAYFNHCLNEIWSRNQKIHEVYVLTDGPRKQMIYTVPSDQRENWYESPNFDGQHLLLNGRNLENDFQDERFIFKFLYGGDPLLGLEIMSKAENLIIGRSSFGYLGALLNKNGIIFVPSSFWHTPRSNWNVIEF